VSDTPDRFAELERTLRQVHFRPRESLKPEVLGRLRRGDVPRRSPASRFRPHLVAAAVAGVLIAGAALAFAGFVTVPGAGTVTVDRCCYDLDGGGDADDGVLVVAERDSRVHRLLVYEDLDGSRSYTPADLVRLDRGEKPAIRAAEGGGIVTTKRCCLDFDGGGPADDGLLVIGVPPNRVLMAAIYETGPKAASRSSADGWLLR
jgi:hypothetical protein